MSKIAFTPNASGTGTFTTEAKQAEWTAYRQALLDVPQQSGFPHNITWPQEPTT